MYLKGVNKNHVINRGNYKYLKKHVAKKILLMKKSTCPQRAHLWLSPLSALVHLITLHSTQRIISSGFKFGWLLSFEEAFCEKKATYKMTKVIDFILCFCNFVFFLSSFFIFSKNNFSYFEFYAKTFPFWWTRWRWWWSYWCYCLCCYV
jgi:hypothetical protein